MSEDHSEVGCVIQEEQCRLTPNLLMFEPAWQLTALTVLIS